MGVVLDGHYDRLVGNAWKRERDKERDIELRHHTEWVLELIMGDLTGAFPCDAKNRGIECEGVMASVHEPRLFSSSTNWGVERRKWKMETITNSWLSKQ